jgi:hypothetical protein
VSIYTSLIALLNVVFSLSHIYVVDQLFLESAGAYRLPVLEFMTDKNLLQTTELDNLLQITELERGRTRANDISRSHLDGPSRRRASSLPARVPADHHEPLGGCDRKIKIM